MTERSKTTNPIYRAIEVLRDSKPPITSLSALSCCQQFEFAIGRILAEFKLPDINPPKPDRYDMIESAKRANKHVKKAIRANNTGRSDKRR